MFTYRNSARIIEELRKLLRGEEWEFPYGQANPRTVVVKYEGYVHPKERPRKGANGTMYTPKETREFERRAAQAMRNVMGSNPPLVGPLKISLFLFDKYEEDWGDKEKLLADHHMMFSTHGDMDNKQKAIQDAANGILYVDDRQIVQYHVKRMYAEEEGFAMQVTQMSAPLKSELKAALS